MDKLTEKLINSINTYTDKTPLTLKMLAESNDCSIHQVRRRVGDKLKKLKKTPKPVKSEEVSNVLISKLLNKISSIENEISQLKNEIKDKNQSNPWFNSLNFTPDIDQLIDIKVNGSIITGEYRALHEIYSSFSEEKDAEWNRIDRKNSAGWLSDEEADRKCKDIENRLPYSNEYTKIRISTRQSSQIEKKLNRIIRHLGA